MFYIIESNEQLSQFKSYDLSDSFIEPILGSDNFHPAISEVIAWLIRPQRSRTPFFIPLANHPESISVFTSEEILALFDEKISKVYTSDKKRLLYHFPLDKPVVCLKTISWLQDGIVLDDKKWNTPAHNFFYSKYPLKGDINKIIPICKWQERWQNYLTDNKKLFSSKMVKKGYFKFYNNTVPGVLQKLESNGICVDNEAFSTHYPDVSLLTMEKNNKIHPSYNIHTSTGRPSSAFGGLNLGAMNKSDDSRSFIIPVNDTLIEFDYHSYHVKILANLIGYHFEEEDIHSHLGKIYFETDELTEQQYSDSKNITFKALYTESEEYKHIPFFKKVKAYRDQVWREFKEKGYLEAILSKRPIPGIESKTQILPYLLQSYETERNILVMSEINQYLLNKVTRFIMYTYDSFLFDWDKEEGAEVLEDLQEILESDGFKASVKFGKNYSEMKQLTGKN